MSKKKGKKEEVAEYKAEAEVIEVEVLDLDQRLCNVRGYVDQWSYVWMLFAAGTCGQSVYEWAGFCHFDLWETSEF